MGMENANVQKVAGVDQQAVVLQGELVVIEPSETSDEALLLMNEALSLLDDANQLAENPELKDEVKQLWLALDNLSNRYSVDPKVD